VRVEEEKKRNVRYQTDLYVFPKKRRRINDPIPSSESGTATHSKDREKKTDSAPSTIP